MYAEPPCDKLRHLLTCPAGHDGPSSHATDDAEPTDAAAAEQPRDDAQRAADESSRARGAQASSWQQQAWLLSALLELATNAANRGQGVYHLLCSAAKCAVLLFMLPAAGSSAALVTVMHTVVGQHACLLTHDCVCRRCVPLAADGQRPADGAAAEQPRAAAGQHEPHL